MKKIYLFLGLLFLSGTSHALWDTVEQYSSSFTTTNETLKVIPNTPPGTVFAGIVIGSSSVGGFLSIFNSSGTGLLGSTITICSLQSSNPVDLHYNVVLSSGLTYTTVGNVGGVTILYKRTR